MELAALLQVDEDDHKNEKALHDAPYENGASAILDLKLRNLSDFFSLSKLVLGDGSYATVCRGHRLSDSQAVAVKKINKLLLFSSTERSFARREVSIHQKLRHENIVQLYDVFESPTSLYLVLELVDGLTLDRFQNRLPHRMFDERLAATIFYQILCAVNHLAEEGVIHADIKPQNILLEMSEEKESKIKVKLCDFGMARWYLEASCSTLVGTSGYLAPEVLEDRRYSFASDMWACGVILYTMLCGVLPFTGSNHSMLHFPKENQISEAANSLISGLLTAHPRKRLRVDQALSHPWLQNYKLR